MGVFRGLRNIIQRIRFKTFTSEEKRNYFFKYGTEPIPSLQFVSGMTSVCCTLLLLLTYQYTCSDDAVKRQALATIDRNRRKFYGVGGQDPQYIEHPPPGLYDGPRGYMDYDPHTGYSRNSIGLLVLPHENEIDEKLSHTTVSDAMVKDVKETLSDQLAGANGWKYAHSYPPTGRGI